MVFPVFLANVIFCAVCERRVEPNESYCHYHKVSNDNLLKTYQFWKKAYGSLSWEEYLARIVSIPETGMWVKDVAEFELRSILSQKKDEKKE
jgi:hypothetical protein